MKKEPKTFYINNDNQEYVMPEKFNFIKTKQTMTTKKSKHPIYDCKENDVRLKVILVDGKPDEVHVQVLGEKKWTVVGYKDLQTALRLAKKAK